MCVCVFVRVRVYRSALVRRSLGHLVPEGAHLGIGLLHSRCRRPECWPLGHPVDEVHLVMVGKFAEGEIQTTHVFGIPEVLDRVPTYVPLIAHALLFLVVTLWKIVQGSNIKGL